MPRFDVTSLLPVIGLSARQLACIHTREEPRLLEQFGQEYADYRQRTSFLLPRIKF